jgi:hypothetical protein
MNPQRMQAIMRKVKSNRGCQIRDFDEWIPAAAEAIDPPSDSDGLDFLPVDDLRQLVQWNLVEAFENNERLMKAREITVNSVAKVTFYLSPFAVRLEDTFNLSLTNYPIFGPPLRAESWPDLFMVMPFDARMEPIFDDHVRKVATELGLSAKRGDDFFSRGSIMQDVWSAIYHSKVIVADCTKRNPNVFYEIGMAHTLGKDTILIGQSLKDIPFDLRHLRQIIYEFTPRGMVVFEDALRATLKDAFPDTVKGN